MDQLVFYFALMLLASIPWIEASFAVPIAILTGANPVISFIVGMFGNIVTLLLAVVFASQIKEWLNKRKRTKSTKRVTNTFEKYGLVGAALLGPILLGSHIVAIIAISMNIPKWQTFIYVSLGTALWAIVLSVLVQFGIDLFGLENMRLLDGA
ncbi:MAG TPA: small multi-drug export protein [Aliicoccus persicus]|uniref:Small multi-drug export protein n=1 Tax=Aliicoccus persicus TaxID=930138 RepID=A0A921B660_9STAP|nr:small multi-drug export protein [Aliicoccus persicus]